MEVTSGCRISKDARRAASGGHHLTCLGQPMYGAPGLHNLNNTWCIYFSGAHPQESNRSHRTHRTTHSSVQQPLPNRCQVMAISRSTTRHFRPLGYRCYSFLCAKFIALFLSWVASGRSSGYRAGSLPASFDQPHRRQILKLSFASVRRNGTSTAFPPSF